eukprot:ctg_3695.g723
MGAASAPTDGDEHASVPHDSEAVSVRDVSKTFRTADGPAVDALRDVSLTVQRGEVLGVLGAAASGKTTLARCLCGSLTPDAGHILIMGRDTLQEPRWARTHIGAVLREASVDKLLTGREHLELLGNLHDLPARKRRHAIERAVELLEMQASVDRPTGSYSDGHRRRLDMALAILHEPPVLLLDEPMAGVDAETRRVIEKVLREMRRDGRSILFTSQDVEEVHFLADRVLVLECGRVAATGARRLTARP